MTPTAEKVRCDFRWPLLDPNEEDRLHLIAHHCVLAPGHNWLHRCACGDEAEEVPPVTPSPGICPNCNEPIIDHDSAERKRCHDAVSGYQR